MTDLEKRAAAVVAEMAELGAVFALSDAGPTGEARWHWRPEPEVMRSAIRRFWTSVEDRSAPGFQSAMVAAIRRHGGAHAQ